VTILYVPVAHYEEFHIEPAERHPELCLFFDDSQQEAIPILQPFTGSI